MAKHPRTIVSVVLIGVVVAVVAYLFWPPKPEARPPDPEPGLEREATEEEPWSLLLGPAGPDQEEGSGRVRDKSDKAWEGMRGEWGARPAVPSSSSSEGPGRFRRGRRAFEGGVPPPERLARWRERFRRRVEIVPLGPAEASLDADQVFEGIQEVRPAMRECVRQAGGFRALRAADGARRGRSVVFDVQADGTVAQGSVGLDTSLPAELASCFTDIFESATFEAPGDEGARVEVRFGGGRRRRPQKETDNGQADRPSESPAALPAGERRRVPSTTGNVEL